MKNRRKDQQAQEPFEADRRVAERRRLNGEPTDTAGRHGMVHELVRGNLGDGFADCFGGCTGHLPTGAQEAAVIEDADDRFAMTRDALAKASGNMHEAYDVARADRTNGLDLARIEPREMNER